MVCVFCVLFTLGIKMYIKELGGYKVCGSHVYKKNPGVCG